MRTLILFCLLLVHYMCLRKQVGCPAYCQECSDDPNDLNCYICATGANFVLGSPLACKPAMVNNCYIDNGSGTCLQCVLQFGLSNNVCSPWPIDYKCAYFSSSGSCLLCGVGLNAEAKGLLYVCKGVVNCLDINSYTIDGKCTECGPNFNLI